MRDRFQWVVAALVCLSFMPCVSASEPAGRQADEQAIRNTGQEYLAALARGDSQAVLGFWTADGDVVDEQGRSYPAREVLPREIKPNAEGEKAEVKVTATSIRFLTADVAIEDGTSEVIQPASPGLPPLGGHFSVIWVKQDGKWRLASLREMRFEPPATAPQLDDLDWMTGEWSGANGETKIEVSARWNATRTFLLRDLKVIHDNNVVLSGAQRIGWDPLTHKIKSWVFDANGGHGEGTWTKVGEAWVVQASGVLGNGQATTSTNVYTPTGKDSFSWRSIGGPSSAESGPGLDIKLSRKPAAP